MEGSHGLDDEHFTVATPHLDLSVRLRTYLRMIHA